MKYLGPSSHLRLNEAVAIVFLFAGLFVFISLASYHPLDPSWDTVTGTEKAANLTGRVGALTSDLCLQAFGLAAYAIPVLILLLGWKWIRSSPIQAPIVKTAGSIMLVGATCAAFGLMGWKPISGAIPAGGLAGSLLADELVASMNPLGAWLFTAATWIVSIYLVSTFEVARLRSWFAGRLRGARGSPHASWSGEALGLKWPRNAPRSASFVEPWRLHGSRMFPSLARNEPPWQSEPEKKIVVEDIPIHALDMTPARPEPVAPPPVPAAIPSGRRPARTAASALEPKGREFKIPPTDLLQEPAGAQLL